MKPLRSDFDKIKKIFQDVQELHSTLTIRDSATTKISSYKKWDRLLILSWIIISTLAFIMQYSAFFASSASFAIAGAIILGMQKNKIVTSFETTYKILFDQSVKLAAETTEQKLLFSSMLVEMKLKKLESYFFKSLSMNDDVSNASSETLNQITALEKLDNGGNNIKSIFTQLEGCENIIASIKSNLSLYSHELQNVRSNAITKEIWIVAIATVQWGFGQIICESVHDGFTKYIAPYTQEWGLI